MGSLQSLVLGRVLNKDLLEGVEEVASFGLPWRLEAGLFWESSGGGGGVRFLIFRDHRLLRVFIYVLDC